MLILHESTGGSDDETVRLWRGHPLEVAETPIRSTTPSADELVGALDGLGLHLLSGGVEPKRVISPAELLAGLVRQSDARLSLAVIALLLYRPDFAPAALDATASVSGNDALTLKLYYTATMLLQKIYHAQLTPLLGQQTPLPDLFSAQFALSGSDSVEERLREVGKSHEALVEAGVNWVGTYHHGAKRLIKRLESEVKWGLR